MALVDTCDGLLVLLTFSQGGGGDRANALLFGALLTTVSATVSLTIGLVVGLGLVAPALPPVFAAPAAAVAEGLDGHTTLVGLCVVGLFVGALALAVAAPALQRAAGLPCCRKWVGTRGETESVAAGSRTTYAPIRGEAGEAAKARPQTTYAPIRIDPNSCKIEV